jgi:hypothetical protein
LSRTAKVNIANLFPQAAAHGVLQIVQAGTFNRSVVDFQQDLRSPRKSNPKLILELGRKLGHLAKTLLGKTVGNAHKAKKGTKAMFPGVLPDQFLPSMPSRPLVIARFYCPSLVFLAAAAFLALGSVLELAGSGLVNTFKNRMARQHNAHAIGNFHLNFRTRPSGKR